MALHTFEASGGSEFEHAVVEVSRVSRTVKGGRRFRFRAAVLVGDRKGRVGFGLQKGKDVQSAIQKAEIAAKKRMQRVPLHGTTIPHNIVARYRGAVVLLKPAPSGAGIIAGGPIRSLASLAGIHDLSSKLIGSRTKVNVVRAALKALNDLQQPRSSSSVAAAEASGSSSGSVSQSPNL